MPGWLAERNVYLKSFENVPMADIELTFPDKKAGCCPLLAGACWLLVPC
jgi:hypothetical protein